MWFPKKFVKLTCTVKLCGYAFASHVLAMTFASHMWWLWLLLVTCDCYDMKYGVPKYLLKRPIKSFLVIYYSKIIQYCCWDFTRWKMKIANHSCWKKITRALRALVIFFQHLWLAIFIFQLVKSQQHYIFFKIEGWYELRVNLKPALPRLLSGQKGLCLDFQYNTWA